MKRPLSWAKAMGRTAARTGLPVVAALILLPLLWLIEPFWRLRFTHLWCARFGPLAFNTHLWVGTRAIEGQEPRTTRIFFGAKPANRQLFEMWKRVLPIVESQALSAAYHYCSKLLPKTRFFAPLPQDIKTFSPFLHQPVLSFTPAEEQQGRRILDDMGIGPNDWWVCFQARDPSYHGQRGFGDSGTNRDCSIENYLVAAAAVTARGGWAVRMGAVVERPLPETGNPRIIDYATCFRSDFTDIYLLGKCRFLLGCGTGTLHAPPLFGIPVAEANTLSLRPVPLGRQGLYIPKIVHEIGSNRVLSMADCARLDAFEYDDLAIYQRWEYPGGLEKMGIWAEENTPEDIGDLTLDMFDLIEGRAASPAAVALQQLLKARFFSHIKEARLMPDIGPRFALKYRYLIEN